MKHARNVKCTKQVKFLVMNEITQVINSESSRGNPLPSPPPPLWNIKTHLCKISDFLKVEHRLENLPHPYRNSTKSPTEKRVYFCKCAYIFLVISEVYL